MVVVVVFIIIDFAVFVIFVLILHEASYFFNVIVRKKALLSS